MKKPAPYPSTDTAEQEAVTVFRTLIDLRFVKDDIKTRDKYPNVDGTLELVDREQVPLGKLEVQIRKIGEGKTVYSCPASLAAYSGVSTLPVLLVCVDPSTKRAFWRQITPVMPEYKENQESFTIHFSESSDSIDEDGAYIQKWTAILLDYRERIAKFPTLCAEVANMLNLDNIATQDRKMFQHFIGTVNSLLDSDFIAVKQVLFPDVWRLGVGVLSADQDRLWYQLYRIPYGEPAPLVCKLESGALSSNQPNSNAISEHAWRRESLASPEEAGRQFVLEYVQRVVKRRDLPIHGRLLASDVLISFVDQFYHCLGIAAGRDSYLVADLDYALNRHLPGLGAAIVLSMTQGSGGYFHLDLDWVSRYLAENDVPPVSPNDCPVHFSMGTRWFSVRSAFESLRYLLANEIVSIDRPFARRTIALPPGSHWMWSGFSREDEISSVTRILTKSAEEYTAFVRGNRLRFPNSPYLDAMTSIVFQYEPAKPAEGFTGGPNLEEYHIVDPHQRLPKVSVFVKSEKDREIDVVDYPIITILENQYQAASWAYGVADFLFERMPVLNLIYRMLARDLSNHYDMPMTSTLS
jgi:hypothetical protein